MFVCVSPRSCTYFSHLTVNGGTCGVAVCVAPGPGVWAHTCSAAKLTLQFRESHVAWPGTDLTVGRYSVAEWASVETLAELR